MLLKQIKIPSALSLSLSLILLSQTANAFDTAAFKTLDETSPATAKAFLALPLEERQKISLELLAKEGEDAPKPVWQVFLAADLTKNLPEDSEAALASLSTWKDEYFEEISESEPDKTPAAGQMCIAQLQHITTDEGEDGDALGRTLDEHCIKQLGSTLEQTNNFEWFTGLLKSDSSPERAYALRNMVIPNTLNAVQSQQVVDIVLPAVQAADVDEMGEFGVLLQKIDNKAVLKALFSGMSQSLVSPPSPDAQNDPTHALNKLVWLNTTDSATLFWASAFKDKHYLQAAKEGLSAYIDQASDSTVPEVFHATTLQQITDKQDIHLAATYLSWVTKLESSWEHGLATIAAVEEIDNTIPTTPENQALLKYIYLQGAGSQYSDKPEDLGAVITLLDKAAAIPGEPLSWYQHLTGEAEDERADQRDNFKSIQKLYASKELTRLATSLSEKTAPETPFKDLPLELYGSLLGKTLIGRLSHNPETGAALLLDEDAELSYFNGKTVANEEAPFTIKTISTDGFVSKPTLTSPLMVWFTYGFNALTGDDASTASSYQMSFFAAENKSVDQRLLFEILDDGESEQYPNSLEYVRYGSEILLNLDVGVEDEIQQAVLTFPDPQKAEQWLTALTQQPPLGTRAHPLWYHTWDDTTRPLQRLYTNVDFDKANVTLNPKAADTQFVVTEGKKSDCDVKLDTAQLESHAVGFQKAEYALYQQGYQLHSLVIDNHCD